MPGLEAPRRYLTCQDKAAACTKYQLTCFVIKQCKAYTILDIHADAQYSLLGIDHYRLDADKLTVHCAGVP